VVVDAVGPRCVLDGGDARSQCMIALGTYRGAPVMILSTLA